MLRYAVLNLETRDLAERHVASNGKAVKILCRGVGHLALLHSPPPHLLLPRTHTTYMKEGGGSVWTPPSDPNM